MEIVSQERQRARYERGLSNAAQIFTLDDEDAEALGLTPGARMTKRELGLRTMAKTWSAEIDEVHEQHNYRDAMDEATEEFTPEGATEPTTVYEQGVLKTSQEDWVSAIVNRGVDKYRNAMSPEFAYAHYRGATAQVADWLESITMPTKERTNTFSADTQIGHNIDRVRAVAQGMHAQATGQDMPGVATGNPVPVAAPAPAAMGAEYEIAFDELNGIQEYARVFDPDQRVQPPPDWHGKALAKADVYADVGQNLELLARNWYSRTSAVAEEDFLDAATSDRATSNYQAAISGPNSGLVVDSYMDGYAPYREALTSLPLDEIAPRGPTGSDANMARVATVAGMMLNTKYIGFDLAGTGEFTPYGAGGWANLAGWIDDVMGAWGL